MSIILKYEVPIPDKDFLSLVVLPAGGIIRHVASQEWGDEKMFIWVESPGDKDWATKLYMRKIWVFPTGEPFDPAEKTFLGTVIMRREGLVWHLYEEKP